MIEIFDLTAAFLIGLGSSAHCMGMCGGIAAGFSTQGANTRAASILLFNTGRLISYALLGLVAGLLVSTLSTHMSATLLFIRIFAGLLLISMGLYVSGWWFGLARLEKLALPLWSAIQPLTKRIQAQKNISKIMILGLLWGFLPCGLIYSTLVWASASSSALQSSVLMLFMGLGTLPTLVGISFVGGKLLQTPLFRRASGLMLICYGVWTVSLPLQHLLVDRMAIQTTTPHQLH